MKRNILLYTLFTSLLFIRCNKDDGPIAKGDGVTIDDVPFMKITKVAGFTGDIIPSTIATYVGKIKVEMHYAYVNPNLKTPDKVDLVIIKNGNKGNIKVLKAGITGPYPIEVSFTGPELVALFGSVTTCDAFQVGYDVYANGKKYEAYPPGGVGLGGATDPNQPGYSVLLNYSTKIEYDPDLYSGIFKVVSDGWQDMSPGDELVITKIDATHFSFIYNPSPQFPNGSLLDAVPIIVTVTPATFALSVTNQHAGSGWTYQAGEVRVFTQAGSSLVPACTASATLITLNFAWSYGGPSTFYAGTLVLKKK